jgi:putative flippase GtrA
MPRLERVLFLGIPVAMSPVLDALLFPVDAHAMHWVAVAGIVFVGGGSHATAIFRLLVLLRALGAKLTEAASRPLPVQVVMHVLAAAGATGADYGVVLALIRYIGLSASEATALGCVVGGALNYVMNRALTFWSTDPKLPQVGRYALVSGTSALLNAGGVALLALHPALDYRVAWWLVRGAVYVTWNFPLHRSFVFAPQRLASPPSALGVSQELRS